jgi:hypothetical protein
LIVDHENRQIVESHQFALRNHFMTGAPRP